MKRVIVCAAKPAKGWQCMDYLGGADPDDMQYIRSAWKNLYKGDSEAHRIMKARVAALNRTGKYRLTLKAVRMTWLLDGEYGGERYLGSFLYGVCEDSTEFLGNRSGANK